MDVSTIRNSQPAAIRPAPKLTDSQIGYLLKERVFDVASLTEALRRLADGETVVDLTIVARLFFRKRRPDPLSRWGARHRGGG